VIGVLALQGNVREHVTALTACGAQARPIRRPEELSGIDGIVIPGGESTTIGKLAVDFGLLDPLRKLLAEGMPAFGSCAGMIMLADRVLDGRPDQQTIGGIDMTVRRNAFGRQVDSFETTLRLHGVPGDPLPAVFIRAPWVESVGEGVEVLARISGGPADGRIVAVRQRHLMATSFHPELTNDRRVHQLFIDMVTRAAKDRAAERGLVAE